MLRKENSSEDTNYNGSGEDIDRGKKPKRLEEQQRRLFEAIASTAKVNVGVNKRSKANNWYKYVISTVEGLGKNVKER
ncbi:hypothetical protein JOB18_020387 [Solea senegalensis]|uniref:Uncharacterized protein n=1 Tax=Solea senegalensis TaxID=28829 RepID=A0AAV6Q1W1_SOLSE|nr:hypothetical protein JOB18_020387 [Solea senegalensis]